MADAFADYSAALDSPAAGAAAVTPHDANELATISRALYIGGTGDLVVTMQDGVDATFIGVPAGFILPVRVSKVKVTGTSATNIVAMY